MKRCEILIKAIEKEKIDTILYMPCSTMIDIIEHFQKKKDVSIFPISREEEGIGLITGLFLSGKKPLLMIQDSGLGNSYNAIITLLKCYQIPVVILITRRGSVGEVSAPNALWADNTSMLNKVLGLQEFLLGVNVPIELWGNAIQSAFHHAKLVNNPVLLQVNLRNRGEYSD